MVTTIHAHKAGTTEYVAFARDQIPLADPTAWGNGGLEGFDEDGEERRFKSKAAAVAWLRRRHATTKHMVAAEVTRVVWERDEIHDDEYGVVVDAYEQPVYRWYYWGGGGELLLDDECAVRS